MGRENRISSIKPRLFRRLFVLNYIRAATALRLTRGGGDTVFQGRHILADI